MDQNIFDEHFSRALEARGDFEHGGNELIASGILIFRTVDMASDSVNYGFASYGGEIPLHEIIGMLELTKVSAIEVYKEILFGDEEEEEE